MASPSEMAVKSEGPYPLQRGSRISIRLKVDGLKCLDSHKWVTWTGEIGNTAFVVEVPLGIGGSVSWHSLDSAQRLRNRQDVFPRSRGTGRVFITEIPSQTKSYRRAFASYASEDRVEVAQPSPRDGGRLQGSSRVLWTSSTCDQGRIGNESLQSIFRQSDVFYLFWCRHAMKSDWVDKEWHWALAAKGQDFIDPVPLQKPELAPPPKELAAKHFNDPLLAFIAAAGCAHSD